ncbi:hypothetical protein V6N11_022210 [Hibiscus sabdariffa]|uniref:NET domain-containing protein n=1 Tax=Hibiscus sabdariffa TaxID=183260 RepID=A0ABR2TII1_9ROSI
MIQKLPNENLARVVEIIQRGRPTGNTCGEENFVDLEKEENVALWRLYYYVEAVEKAKMLAQLKSITLSDPDEPIVAAIHTYLESMQQDAVGHYSHSCDPPDKDKVCDTPPNSELDPDNEEIMSLDLIVEPQSTSSA